MTLKDDLLPTGKNRLMDLVQAAGIDVSEWGRYARGPKWAAANPAYCYEWSFEANGIVVLNLWHANVSERRGVISVSTNMRAARDRLIESGAKSVWIKRAGKMDEAIQKAVRERLTVRVIINDGDMRDSRDPKARASVVKRRHLDPSPWSINAYDRRTGKCVLVRGGHTIAAVDQFDLPYLASAAPEQVDVHGVVFVRNPAVRRAVLARAQGSCEYCGRSGFATAHGQIFLETHHILPLSDGGSDDVSNVAAVCPNHHREAHHGAKAPAIREFLLEIAAQSIRVGRSKKR